MLLQCQMSIHHATNLRRGEGMGEGMDKVGEGRGWAEAWGGWEGEGRGGKEKDWVGKDNNHPLKAHRRDR